MRHNTTAFATLLLCLLMVPQSSIADEPASPLYNSEKEAGEPLEPNEALKRLELPPGFSATLFAAEPDVMNPIAACTDARGRVWVAENFTYAERAVRFDMQLNDRVLVLEDTDGDGVHDRRTVFADNLKVLTGITVGRGGVWLMAPPQLLFIPDANDDLIPDGPAEVKLDGFHNARDNYHNFANGLSWGPDGWLYGRCGASCPGDMGLPGSTDEQRVPMRGGMWRYHPERQAVEALTQGTTNPWGHDWNEVGDLFFINTVNGHFWQCIPGAHFVRPHTLDLNPHSYELIDMHADHWHFDTGKSWTASRDGAANDFGGGHAHIGMMIYQESTWPEAYSGKAMTVNMHGRRVNVESLGREGSGWTASHDPDFLMTDDFWFRGMDLLPLSDGNVLLVDWSDIGECHEQTGVHRTSGRIYKITYQGSKPQGSNSRDSDTQVIAETRRSIRELAELQSQASTWESRRGREQMTQLRLAAGVNATEIATAADLLHQQLKQMDAPTPLRLRALWSLIALDRVDDTLIDSLLVDKSVDLRVWGVRLAVDNWRLDTAYGNRPYDVGEPVTDDQVAVLVDLAKRESSAKVRLELASALQRLPYEHRARLAKELVIHASDSEDHNLPLMVWYGLIPLGDDAPRDLLSVLSVCEWPITRQMIARRIADQSKKQPELFDAMFTSAEGKSEQFKVDLIRGAAAAFAGWSKASAPKNWQTISSSLDGVAKNDGELASQIQNLSILFGDGRTVDQLKSVVLDSKASLELRKSALRTLVESRANGTKSLCLSLLRERFLNSVAASGLARESDPEIGQQIVENYRRFHPSERPLAVSILCSRPAWATALLQAVEKGAVDRSEISAFQARQIFSLNDPQVEKLLTNHWGQIRGSSQSRIEKIDELRNTLKDGRLDNADPLAGRKLFMQSCGKCHLLFGEGGKLGPDLTGAQRSDLTYLVENIVDPSAVVTKEFRSTVILLDDGRVLTGLVTEKTENVVTLETQDEQFKIATDEIEQMRQSDQSTMPEGLLDQLSEQQIADLFAYLQSTQRPN